MNIAFYAPMKSPNSQSPSGDRLIGRLFIMALEGAGHKVTLASDFRSYEGSGDSERQDEIRNNGKKLSRELLAEFKALPRSERPDLWFTYHLYHKAPDWIGPDVAAGLDIPYVAAEASFAPKQENGPWAQGHKSIEGALRQTALVIGLNKIDEACVRPLMNRQARYLHLEPFLDVAPYAEARARRAKIRAGLAQAHNIAQDKPWLLAAAMMRPGDKLSSYKILAEALDQLQDREWRLLVAGEGKAYDEVRRTFSHMDERIEWLGLQNTSELAGIYAACDILVWPGVNEAIGMCYMEAQASGIPVVTGHDDASRFSNDVKSLLDDRYMCAVMGKRACARMALYHGIDQAGRKLSLALERLST